jgi:hypothetical protein
VFLERIAEGWTAKDAAVAAGVHRQRFFEARAADPEFAAAWEQAHQEGVECLEDELRRRGVEGWFEETYDADGQLVRRVRRTDTHALVTRLKAMAPERYRDNGVARVEVTGANGGPVELDGFQPTTLAAVVELARELGVVDVVEGEATEVEPLELGEGNGG